MRMTYKLLTKATTYIMILFLFILTKGITNDEMLILINDQNPVPNNWEVELVNFGRLKIAKIIEDPLTKLFEQAKSEGIHLILASGYRSKKKQEENRKNNIDFLIKTEKMTLKQAIEETNRYFAEPGKSEHETGLAVDILSEDFNRFDEGFADTDAGKWVAEHGPEFGFIIRYPKDKVDTTGKAYEPWHLRYLGKKVAKEITDEGICLEEWHTKNLKKETLLIGPKQLKN